MQNTIADRHTASSLTALALAAVALGLAVAVVVAPAEAGNVGRPHMWPTAGTKPMPNPVVRDHRQPKPICGPWAKTPDDCRKPPRW
jgi:hypothetical protein